jgi:hypothetical protein
MGERQYQRYINMMQQDNQQREQLGAGRIGAQQQHSVAAQALFPESLTQQAT